MRHFHLVLCTALGVIFSADPSLAAGPPSCAPGTTCLSVNDNGTAGPGPSTAQCSGLFPDFIFASGAIPANYAGPWFRLAQSFPSSAPPLDAPWLAIDFKTGKATADAYLLALRDYAFEGMIENDFRPEQNKVRAWFHMPLMNFGGNRREPAHGLTGERSVKGPELGLKPGVSIHDYAVGFYNATAAATIGAVWSSGVPDVTKSHFAKGSMAFKILFSDAVADNFQDPSHYILDGAPAWTILTNAGPKTVRLMQMDVAATSDASPTGWVFGTFAFDPQAKDESPWRRLRPVGLSWGNDPGFTPSDQQPGHALAATIISDQAPAYAAHHLGWAGRANGPVDNPVSGCLSCHGTAEYPVAAQIAPFSAKCDSDAKKLHWFRDFDGAQPFGATNADTCLPTTPTVPLAALDFSLQMQVSVQSTLQFGDRNPCAPQMSLSSMTPSAKRYATKAYQNAPRVSRGGEP